MLKKMQKLQSKTNQDGENDEIQEAESSEAAIKKEIEKKHRMRENARKKSEAIKKMFMRSLDRYDEPLKWWERPHVKYAITYPWVRPRLERIMGSPVVRLTDHKFMSLLRDNIQRDFEEQQRIRIEKRKLSPPSVIDRLMEISYRALTERVEQQKHRDVKFFI